VSAAVADLRQRVVLAGEGDDRSGTLAAPSGDERRLEPAGGRRHLEAVLSQQVRGPSRSLTLLE
jgi:hypothetical protein